MLPQRRPLDDAFEGEPSLSSLETRDRAFARLLVATMLRRLGQIDALIARCLDRPLPPRPSRAGHAAARRHAAPLPRTPAHAAVATSVELRRRRGFRPHKGLVNAVLRRLSRKGRAGLRPPRRTRRGSTRRIGCGTPGPRPMASAPAPSPPPIWWRRRSISRSRGRRKAGRRGWAQILPTGSLRRTAAARSTRCPASPRAPGGCRTPPRRCRRSCWGESRGKRVIDLCAAPGGKTAQLAAAGAHVTAVDRVAQRLRRLRPISRARPDGRDRGRRRRATGGRRRRADAVLLDAPCTATGTIRRHPDLPWLKNPEDMAKLAGLQDAPAATPPSP